MGTDFEVDEEEEDSWMIDTPEGNLTLAAVVLFVVLCLVLILFGFYCLLRNVETYTPGEEALPAAQPTFNAPRC